MSYCRNCGKYFSITKQSDYCPDCEFAETEKAKSKTTDIKNSSMVGWVCPVCGRGLSPWTSCCPCKIDSEIKISY